MKARKAGDQQAELAHGRQRSAGTVGNLGKLV
jgi:hypothetical protein